jgi:hypothetical protein
MMQGEEEEQQGEMKLADLIRPPVKTILKCTDCVELDELLEVRDQLYGKSGQEDKRSLAVERVRVLSLCRY